MSTFPSGFNVSNPHCRRFKVDRRSPYSSSCDAVPPFFAHAQQHSMAEKEDASDLESVSPCEYKALKECLDRNQGKKEKCEKEWQEFQNACTNNKRWSVFVMRCERFHVPSLLPDSLLRESLQFPPPVKTDAETTSFVAASCCSSNSRNKT